MLPSSLSVSFFTAWRWNFWLSNMSGMQWKTSSLLLSVRATYCVTHLHSCFHSFPSSRSLLFLCQYCSQAKNRCTTKDFSSEGQGVRTDPRKWKRTDSKPRVISCQTRCGVGVKATCRHAAFLNRTLGEPSSMQCSIMCVLSPDWVALKCKYLWDKVGIWVNTEGHCVVLGKEKHPQKPSAWKPAFWEAFLKDWLFISLFISLTVSSLRWDGIFMGAIFLSTIIHWKPAAVLRPRLSLVH